MHLEANGSTARTLNLLSIWKRHNELPEYKANPFFRSPVLNRSIILKHRLRPHERDMLQDGRTSATKVILPIDVTDLRAGARSFFVGERGYTRFLAEISGGSREIEAYDQGLLELLDLLPSLDPFLMRERLQKRGFNPARCYFDLSEADVARMFQFVRKEVTPLIGLTIYSEDALFNEKTSRLANKILANAGDAELEPLRQSLGMTKTDFEEGVFCWKGFIYYKWTLTDILPKILPIGAEIAEVTPHGATSTDEKTYIATTRARLGKEINKTCETVRTTLKVYDDAYAGLTRAGKPQEFRDFLLRAPSLFYELGERLGAVQHIVSFWRFRFPTGRRTKLNAEELTDLFADFEASLSFEADHN